MDVSNGSAAWRKNVGKTVKITVCGDVCTTWAGESDLLAGRAGDILQSVQGTLEAADLRVVQWEVVLTDKDAPILKCGPNLRTDPRCADFLKKGKFDVALMANNHTGDHGEAGVLSTLDVLKKAKIRTVGAGKNAEDARKVLHLTRNGFKIAILNFCEQEFGGAWEDHAGANTMNELFNLEQIAAEKRRADIVLAVMHGGNETNPIPSPRVKQLCRAFASAGASAVVNIHTHCPQGIEVYKGVPIVYSVGNFFFPEPEERYDITNFWWSGYIPTFTFDRRGACSIAVTPYKLEHSPWKITALTGKERTWFLNYLTKISEEMQANGDHWYDVWCAYRYTMPFGWYRKLQFDALEKDPEDPAALQGLPAPRHMFTCQAHCELTKRVMLLLERKRIKALQKEIPALTEMQKARFAECGGTK